jgi:hypothetical protein
VLLILSNAEGIIEASFIICLFKWFYRSFNGDITSRGLCHVDKTTSHGLLALYCHEL